MSKYLDKQALLKWLEQRYRENHEEFEVDRSRENLKIINEIKSGTFNADESEPDDYESMVLLDAYCQIHRLREALEEVRECLDDFWDRDTPRRLYKEVRRFAGQIHVMEKVINQALSTTSEPTNAAKVERVREPVAWFAQQMEAKLRENDHKGGWENCSLDWLVERLYQEAKELWIEVDRVDTEPKRIIREAADVANFAMMIADIARRINAPEGVES